MAVLGLLKQRNANLWQQRKRIFIETEIAKQRRHHALIEERLTEYRQLILQLRRSEEEFECVAAASAHSPKVPLPLSAPSSPTVAADAATSRPEVANDSFEVCVLDMLSKS